MGGRSITVMKTGILIQLLKLTVTQQVLLTFYSAPFVQYSLNNISNSYFLWPMQATARSVAELKGSLTALLYSTIPRL